MILELSFAAAVKLAQDNNADLKAARATLASTAALESVARAGYLPQVNGTISYSESGGTQAAPGAVDQSGSYTGSLALSQNLFAGLETRGSRRQAGANTRAARATLEQTRAQVGYDLVAAFAGVIFATESRQLVDDIIRRREENLGLVTLRFRGGRENQGSVLLSEAYLDEARFDALQSQNDLRVARAQLARALGLDEYVELKVSGEVPVRAPATTGPNLVALAGDTPDLNLARARSDAATDAVTVARSPFYPRLSINAATNHYGPDFFPEERTRWSMGVSLTLPLFNGGADYFNLRTAAEKSAAAEFARVNVARQKLADLEQGWADYVEGVAKLRVTESFRRAAGLRAEIARKKYNNGLQTFEDWDVIENDLIKRQKDYLTSKRDRTTAEANWNKILGQGAVR